MALKAEQRAWKLLFYLLIVPLIVTGTVTYVITRFAGELNNDVLDVFEALVAKAWPNGE